MTTILILSIKFIATITLLLILAFSSLNFIWPVESQPIRESDLVGTWFEKSQNPANYSQLILFEDSTFVANNINNFNIILGSDSLVVNGERKYIVKRQGEGITGNWRIEYDSINNSYTGMIYTTDEIAIYREFEIIRTPKFCIFPSNEFEIIFTCEGYIDEYWPQKTYHKTATKYD